MCRYALGIFHESSDNLYFGNEKLIGCLIYGFPVGRSAASSLVEGLENNNVLELTRLYIDDGYGSNIESYSISQSFRWLREYAPNIKALLSYADNGQKHLGKIYQATNWEYQGLNTDMNLMPNWGISIQENPHKWIHSRTVFATWGSHNLEHLKREIGKDGYKSFWRRQESGKHRYVQILGKDKKEKRELLARMKNPSKPYPKDVVAFQTEITEFITYEPDKSNAVNFW